MHQSSVLSAVSSSASSKHTINVTVNKPPRNSQLGIVPNEQLELVKIQTNSPANRLLHIGDRILFVNNKPVATQDELLAAMQSVDGSQIVFTVSRDVHRIQPLPSNREHLVTRHAGFDYREVVLLWSRALNKRVGLHVKESCNKVLVARTDQNTAAAECLRAGDRIVDVNGTPVTSRVAAKQFICESLASTQKASMIIERPNNSNTLNDIMRQIHQTAENKALSTGTEEPCLPPDCVALVSRELQRRTAAFKNAPGPRSQHKGPVSKAQGRRAVQMTTKVNNVPIGQDTDPNKYLRNVGRRHS